MLVARLINFLLLFLLLEKGPADWRPSTEAVDVGGRSLGYNNAGP